MSGPARLPAAVNANGVSRVATAIPLHRIAFTKQTLADPDQLLKQLTELEKALYDGTKHARANPESRAIDFEDVPCGAGGAKVYIRHNLGRLVRWRGVDWAGNGVVDGAKLVCDRLDTTPETNASTLALRSYVAGTATIRIYEVP